MTYVQGFVTAVPTANKEKYFVQASPLRARPELA
jgi:uncharacterized protein YbaA (DUF1428 family)